MGVTVLCLSRDDAASHRAFQEKFSLKFPLLSDPDRKTHDAYGAWGERPGRGEGVIRSTFLVDERGKIKKAWYGVKADGHAKEVLDALNS
jgi:peroxiredoxin Q/BCP